MSLFNYIYIIAVFSFLIINCGHPDKPDIELKEFNFLGGRSSFTFDYVYNEPENIINFTENLNFEGVLSLKYLFTDSDGFQYWQLLISGIILNKNNVLVYVKPNTQYSWKVPTWGFSTQKIIIYNDHTVNPGYQYKIVISYE